MVVYVVLQLLYSAYLKHLPVVDLAVVASAFLLRAIAGRRDRHPTESVVLVGRSLWFVLHGFRQAVFGDEGARGDAGTDGR